jgi:hypothetical protein
MRKLVGYRLVVAQMPVTFSTLIENLVEEGYEPAHKDYYPRVRGKSTAEFMQVMLKYENTEDSI